MLTGWECYLWLKLDTIIKALTLIGIGLPAFFVIKALLSEVDQRISKSSKSTIYLTSVIGAICLFLAIAIPNREEFAAIYILPKLTTSNPHVVKELKTSSSRICCKLLLSYTNQLLKEIGEMEEGVMVVNYKLLHPVARKEKVEGEVKANTTGSEGKSD